MINSLIDFTSGALSGITNCLSGFMLDTVKVRMQMNPSLTMTQTFQSIVRQEGAAQLFSGIYYPLITIPMISSIVFVAYEQYKVIRNKDQLGFWDGFQNGAFAGLVVSVVVTPVELVKCVMQYDRDKKFSHSRQCLKHVIRTEGVAGLYKGNVSTLNRQIPGYAAQFAAYQYIKGMYVSPEHPHLTLVQTMIVSPITAIWAWLLSYPQDVIKTKIQVQKTNKYKSIYGDGGIINCSKQIYRAAGWKGFWIGIVPCLIRAVFSDSISLITYEKCREAMWSHRTH